MSVVNRDPVPWAIGAVALLLGLVFVEVDLTYNRGELTAPLDDTYIHLQYGRQIGLGHFFQYSTGDPISTGASSFLYVLVLGAAYASGFHGDSLLSFTVGFGVVCLALTSACVAALGRRLAAPQVGVWSGVLVATSGPLLWGATSGMEVSLTALLLVASMLAFTRGAPAARFTVTAVLAALLAVTRPEGLIFSVALCGAMWWEILACARRRRIGPARALFQLVWSLLPLAAAAGQLLFYRWATGTVAANGVQAKSLLDSPPVFYPTEFVREVLGNARGFVDVFAGMSSRDFTFPGAIFFFATGVFYLALHRRAWRSIAIAAGVGFVTVLLAVSTLKTAHTHHLRYVQPLIPVFLVLVVTGVYGVTHAFANSRSRRFATHGLLATALMFSLSALPAWGVRLGGESATIRDAQVSAGDWINRNLPDDAVVGVKDVGAMSYFGGRRVVDLVGLTTNNLAQASNNGAGTLYEALRHMPAERRPNYFVLYEPAPGPSIRSLREAGVLGDTPLATFEVRTPTPPEADRIVPFTQVGIYQADWRTTGAAQRPQAPPPGAVRDHLNVGDLDSERAHSYRPQPAHIGIQPDSLLRSVSLPDGTRLVDSGRHIVGGEAFTVRDLVPGRPLTITSRADVTKPAPEPDGALPDTGERAREAERTAAVPAVRVLLDGVPIGNWEQNPTGDGWQEFSLQVPGHLVTGPTVRIELAPLRPMVSPHPDYQSFGYWFSQ